MLDFERLPQYRENNRIEAKKALGGLPSSIWETYSAFANTMGGYILLGVEEQKDKSFRAVDLPDPDDLIREFWELVNKPNKASVNILFENDVFTQIVDGCHIVVIHVPRAERTYQPIYLDGNPFCAYRRNGEGDYKCTADECKAMLRDASVRSQDMKVLEEMELSVLNAESLSDYRQRMKLSRPAHIWESLEDEEFLMRLGAAGIGSDGRKHPTAAGLLMFGNEYDIVREFGSYFLDFQVRDTADARMTDRICSSSGDWSGNVYDFYFRVCSRLTQDIPSQDGIQGENTPVHLALREALANCLVHADYYGQQGVVITKTSRLLTFSNPGGFRIELDAAKNGGISDPRNSTILKMFNFIDIGERTGGGIPNIFHVWRENGWTEPQFTELPNRILLTLHLEKIDNRRSAVNIGDKNAAIKERIKASIVQYLTDNPSGKCSEIADYLGIGSSRTRDYLLELTEEGVVTADDSSKSHVYRLKY